MTVDPEPQPSSAYRRVLRVTATTVVAAHKTVHRLPAWLPLDPGRERRRSYLWLALVTLLAGVIRFYHLGQPCLWYDESKVFYRTCGTYAEMLDCLRTDGFVPLHYSLIWLMAHPLPLEPMLLQTIAATALLGLIGLGIFVLGSNRFRWWAAVPLGLIFLPAFLARHSQSAMPLWHPATGKFVLLTPVLIRLVAAVSGTLTVPAIYFLARQLLPRGTSLLAALLAATSAFSIFYSRDAKMYPDAWFFVTLNAGCFFWWVRKPTGTRWLCWVATGAAGVGLHASAGIVVGLSPLLLLVSTGLKWRTGLAWLAGVSLIFAGIVGYYENFNRWIDRIEDGGWQRSELAWVQAYNYGRTGPQLVRTLSTAIGYGWEWPKADTVVKLPPPRFNWPARAGIALVSILAIAALPWPARWRRTPLDSPAPQWRVLFALSLWIVVPAYGFYCYSVPGFASPLDWLDAFGTAFPRTLAAIKSPAHLLVVVLLIVGFSIPRWRGVTRRFFAAAVVVAAIVGLCYGVFALCDVLSKSATEAGRGWKSLWVPRYLGFIWPAAVVAAAALLARLPGRAIRSLAVAVFVGVNLTFAALRIAAATEPPTDRMAADAFVAADPQNQTLNWARYDINFIGPGGGNLYSEPGEYYLQLLRNGPTTPAAFRAGPRQRFDKVRDLPAIPLPSEIPAQTRQIIFWEVSVSDQVTPTKTDAPPVIPGWVVLSTDTYAVRDCWTWVDLYRYTRRVYVPSR